VIKIFVVDNENQKSKFKPKKIRDKIMEETGLDILVATNITRQVVGTIKKNYQDEISTSTIRSLINAQLVKRGLTSEELKSRKLGMSVADYEDLIQNGCNDNANISYSPEMISKYAYDSIAKEYALLTQPTEQADAHINGLYHEHDLEFYNLRPNCMNYDLRFFARNGLKIDGKGLMGSVAKPAKSLEVLLNHMLQALMAGATVFSGGQGYANFNTLLAPYCVGRSYKEIKQAIQNFVFNCNMSLICRGGQVLFSSIGVDLSIPKVLADEPAVCPGGIEKGTYKDYQEEADLIFRAICEVLDEKDGNNAYHRFPNTLFNIRDGDLDKYEGNCKLLHELGANNPTIYYVNCKDIERTVMGCRTALPMNYAYNYEDDCLNTGNFMYNTLNLPLIALEVDGDENDFYTKLNDVCEIAYDNLHHRRKEVIDVIYNKHLSDFLLQEDKETGKPLYDIDRTTITLGFCGLNECLEVLYGGGITQFEDKGIDIIKFLNAKKEEFNKRDGLRWSVIGSPAESTAHRFAEIIKDKYPNAKVQGIKGSYYLTNSSHIPVDEAEILTAHIKNSAKFHKLTLGGNILHLWLGEVWSDAEALWSLNKKILETGTIFWAYSKVFTYCNLCGFTINEKTDVCPVCKSDDVITYDRITGYYLPVLSKDKNGNETRQWNNGKVQEFKDRYRHTLGDL
jgi:ribonucleoside-triphosphate reductase